MILFPPCKINIGLDILRRRRDGYHDIDTVMFPVRGLCDSLEIIRAREGAKRSEFSFSGIAVDCPEDKNIAVRAWRVMHERYGAGMIEAHLHKSIPFGAGLGGGSSDAAFMLRGLNRLFSLGLGQAELAAIAAELGSDVPFFVYDEALQCTGRGESMVPVDTSLSGYWLTIVKPAVSVSTAEAYGSVKPSIPSVSLTERLAEPVRRWKECITNAFEPALFSRHPELGQIKASLYDAGAVYASLSGSGSALYGIFTIPPRLKTFNDALVWTMPL